MEFFQLGDIQLLRSHVGGREGPSKCERIRTGRRGANVNANVHPMIFESLIQTFKKKKEYKNGQELWLKVEKDQEQYEKTIVDLKGIAAKFHKSSITFCAKAVSQP